MEKDRHKDKIDKTKENIGVSRLDEKTRKDLFEKFVESGGKVIDEKNIRRQLVIDRTLQKEYLKKVGSYSESGQKPAKTKADESKIIAASIKPDHSGVNSLALFFSRLKLRFKLRFLGVTGFGGYFFRDKFFRKFNNSYKPALMDIQILYLDIFRRSPSVGRNITAKLDNIKPVYYELIEMVGNLFDKIMVDQILDQYMNFPQVPKKTQELKEQMMLLYKKLHVIYPFENTIIDAYEQAVDLYLKVEDNPSDSHFGMTRRIRSSVFVIFHKLFPRLHLLFCLYQWWPYHDYDPDIDAILGVTESDKPGNRQLAKYFDELSVPAGEEEQSEEKIESQESDDAAVKGVKYGLSLMASLDLARLRQEYDKTRLFENVSDADKVFITYLLFNEFDREYSFILTTNKIKYRTDFASRDRIDFRSKLNSLYDKMKASTDSLREYADELETYEKSRREKPSSSSQYIEYSKRMESLVNKRNLAGKKALSMVRNYMLEITEELQVLLEDMNEHQIYIENPQDEIIFDPLIEGNKKSNGKKIYEALYIVYCYALAFAYRLSQNGDLSGNLEFKKEEMEQLQKQHKEISHEIQQKQEGEKKKSVLEELDDMV
ncbi:MAG TPA: hypothetical protein PK307_00990 [Spirochaetota bacterium]|nr:hypothetical protein [Spirochaetota bacterium]HOD13415.1 hypothetical protein [Spirochaetota bacterium]HPG49364.1 hypothetical protein [Spirochaetota bacterium]HPN10620.1 hypothetical protein [Spirochaetota bacterium]HQL80748.1 hypothetical protein [Spirochaetota bacterium]